MELPQLLEQVTDENSLMQFIEALASDLDDEIEKEKRNPSSPYGPGANGWENRDLSDFLWTAAAWAESSKNGLKFYSLPNNPWRRMADILYAAKIYE